MYDVIDQRLRTRVTVGDQTWVLRRLGFDDQLRVAGRVAQLLGGVPVDTVAQVYQVAAHMRATVEVATVTAPPDFRWEDQADAELLGAIWDQYRAWEDSFRRDVARDAPSVGGRPADDPAVVVPPDL